MAGWRAGYLFKDFPVYLHVMSSPISSYLCQGNGAIFPTRYADKTIGEPSGPLLLANFGGRPINSDFVYSDAVSKTALQWLHVLI